MDWNRPFINGVYVVDKNQKCKDDDEPVLVMPWFGARHLCVNEFESVFTGTPNYEFKTNKRKEVFREGTCESYELKHWWLENT